MQDCSVSATCHPAALTLHLFGEVTLSDRSDGTRIPLPKSIRELAGCLALHAASRPVRRDALAEMLWPDCAPEISRGRLRTALWRLRQALGQRHAAFVGQDAEKVWLEPDGFPEPPHAAFESAVGHACARPLATLTGGDFDALDAALSLYHAPLMEGYDAAWILPLRERFAELYCRGLECELAWHRVRGDGEGTAWAAQRLLALDPYREDVHALLIGQYAEAGQLRRAMRQFQNCQMAIEGELGVRPDRAREALAEALERAGRTAARRPGDSMSVGSASNAELARILARLEASIDGLNAQVAALCSALSATPGPRGEKRVE